MLIERKTGRVEFKKANIVRVFETVRDIPFRVEVGPKSYEQLHNGLMLKGYGACTSKHYHLGLYYQRNGLDVKYLSMPFQWGDLRVNYPKEIQSLATDLPPLYHCALMLRNGSSWFLVDATWDKTLAKVGFPVNSSSSIFNGMECAVIPCGEVTVHNTSEGHFNYVKKNKLGYYSQDLRPIFYERLNAWLEDVRNTPE